MRRYCHPQYTQPYPTVAADTAYGGCSVEPRNELSGQIAARFDAALWRYRPHIAVIEVGFSDLQRDLAPDYAALANMVADAQAKGVLVVLVALPPASSFDVTAWNSQVRALAVATGATLADWQAGIINPSAQPSVVEYDSNLIGRPLTEGDYPNPDGFEVIWDVLCQALAALGDMG
jgi:hypothetical protein